MRLQNMPLYNYLQSVLLVRAPAVSCLYFFHQKNSCAKYLLIFPFLFQLRHDMIDQKEGETELSVKVHYDNMVSSSSIVSQLQLISPAVDSSIDSLTAIFGCYRDVLQQGEINTSTILSMVRHSHWVQPFQKVTACTSFQRSKR